MGRKRETGAAMVTVGAPCLVRGREERRRRRGGGGRRRVAAKQEGAAKASVVVSVAYGLSGMGCRAKCSDLTGVGCR